MRRTPRKSSPCRAPSWRDLLMLSAIGSCAVDDRAPDVSVADGAAGAGEDAGSIVFGKQDAARDAGITTPLDTSSSTGERHTVTLSVRGDGLGQLTIESANEPAQTCADECTFEVSSGAELVLTAAPGLNTTFRGWSVSECGSATTCRVRIDSDQEVTAQLELAFHVAFISSQSYPVAALPRPGEAANQECARLAAAAGVHGRRFVAWLGAQGPTADAADDVTPRSFFLHQGGWVRRDGQPVARSLASLTRGEILHPIELDETGTLQPVGMWLASSVQGGLARPNGLGVVSDCNNWTSSDPELTGGMGYSNGTFLGEGWGDDCAASHSLLCFGDDSDAEVMLPAVSDRLAFRSTTAFVPSAGLAAADTLCQRDACNAGLTLSSDCSVNLGSARSFKAYLHTSTLRGWERFDLSGPTWARPDGIRWLADALDLAGDAANRLTTLNVRADGSYTEPEPAWLGHHTGAASCLDWTSAGAMDRAAASNDHRVTRTNWSDDGGQPCSTPNVFVHCLEE